MYSSTTSPIVDPIDTGQVFCIRVVDLKPPSSSGGAFQSFGSKRRPNSNNHNNKPKYNFFKTKTCYHYNAQTASGCKFGDRCSFAHGDAELRPYLR